MMSQFLEGFLKSWGVILASEIGDKTFFIAAVMAMKNSRQEVRQGGTNYTPLSLYIHHRL